MTNIVSGEKLEPTVVQAYPYNYQTNSSNIIFIKQIESNEQKYKREVEFKMRQEFEEFLYESFYKRGTNPDEYIKNKLWESFKFNKLRSESSLFSYLTNLWEKFEEEYL